MINIITRSGFVDCYSLGILSVDGTYFCHTLENADRYLEIDPDAKIPGETAAPRGKYLTSIAWSSYLRRDMCVLDAVAGFGTVTFVDRGYDLEGEIILGRKTHDRWMSLDRSVLDVFMGMVDQARRKQQVWTTIS